MIGVSPIVPHMMSSVTRMFEDMLDTLKRLDLTAKDIEMIEAALQTQKKILAVQSEAGGAGARQKLSDLKHLLQRIGRARPGGGMRTAPGFFGLLRCMFTFQGKCSHSG